MRVAGADEVGDDLPVLRAGLERVELDEAVFVEGGFGFALGVHDAVDGQVVVFLERADGIEQRLVRSASPRLRRMRRAQCGCE